MEQKYYKVLRSVKKKLVSANIYFWQRYQNGRINFPVIKNSKMFVFGSIDACRRFMQDEMSDSRHYGALRIYEVEVENPQIVDFEIPCANALKYSVDAPTLIWDTFERCGNFVEHAERSVPPDSYLCDSLRLVKRIQ